MRKLLLAALLPCLALMSAAAVAATGDDLMSGIPTPPNAKSLAIDPTRAVNLPVSRPLPIRGLSFRPTRPWRCRLDGDRLRRHWQQTSAKKPVF